MAEAGETLGSYSRVFYASAEVRKPEDESELCDELRKARKDGIAVTFRAAGYSFDRQALNEQPKRVISLNALKGIHVDKAACLVHVGAADTWGEIMGELLPDLVPAVTVTTSHATAGGTLSANALSRFSSAYGKEGGWVEEATIVTMDGQRHVCRPPRPDVPRDDWTPDERLFMAAVGGLGYIGVFTKITYRVLRVRQPRIRTVGRRFWRLRSFGDAIAAVACQAEQEVSDPLDPTKRDAIYGAVHTGRWLRQAMLFTSSYTEDVGEPMPIHQPGRRLRPWIDWALSTPLNPLVWLVGFGILPRKRGWVDPAKEFAFFQDGNVRTMERFPELKIVQQTYVVPRPALADWLEQTRRHFRRAKVRPALQDVVALPRDRPFYLTVTPNGPAFGVTYTFLTEDRNGEIDRIKAVLTLLSEAGFRNFDARVSLVKNVFADPGTVQAMFGDQVGRFAALRTEFGAKDLLVNDFFDQTLG